MDGGGRGKMACKHTGEREGYRRISRGRVRWRWSSTLLVYIQSKIRPHNNVLCIHVILPANILIQMHCLYFTAKCR